MKYLILTFLFISSSFALTNFEQKELNRRIKLYGLDNPQSNKALIPQEESFFNYDTNIIRSLQDKILTTYIDKLQNQFGNCDKNNCVINNGNYLSFETRGKKVCLPYTQCGFYSCMEEKYKCKPKGVNYFTDLAEPTCKTYVKNIQKKWFSQKGHDWIYSVMVCLQKGLIDECEIRGNCPEDATSKTCEYITDYTLKFHPSCYLNSGIGVCHLPLKDKINIWRTVGKFLTSDERRQAYRVVLACIRGE